MLFSSLALLLKSLVRFQGSCDNITIIVQRSMGALIFEFDFMTKPEEIIHHGYGYEDKRSGRELLTVDEALLRMHPDHVDLPHVVLERMGVEKEGGSVESREVVVGEFPNLKEALSFAHERLASGVTGLHQDLIRLKDDKFGLSEEEGRWSDYSAYNALAPEKD
jgi:hypothetical protein